jgi:hypothetical protein
MRTSIVLKSITRQSTEPGLLQRALLRFRLPSRAATDLEQAAARNRAQRLFEINFRNSWTR